MAGKDEEPGKIDDREAPGLSAGTGKLCMFGHLGLVFIWSCFVSRLLFLLYYVICAPVLTEGTEAFVPYIFFRPFRLSLAPFICPWVSEDAKRRDNT